MNTPPGPPSFNSPPGPLEGTPPPFGGAPASPGAWPPPPDSGGVWPPPPQATAEPLAWFPFKYQALTVIGPSCEFREGAVGIGTSGLVINGKAIPKAEVTVPIYIVAFVFLKLLGILIAYLVFRYAMIKPAQSMIPWNQVRQVVLDPTKKRAGVAFEFLNPKGISKVSSLVFALDPLSYPTFAELVGRFAPAPLLGGKIRGTTSPFLIVILLMLVVVIVIAAMKFVGSQAGTSTP